MAKKIEIKIEGHLDKTWRAWFDDMEITSQGSYTILAGEIKDKAYLHGILNRIRDLNLTLVSVNPNK